ncbi:MAG: SDR family NAD(P)-dependent oxidoreductase [Alphaproteobacteria bacterium]|nr:SDR family NAD(P)-dependent oxidoreductase [Alphaproteobacteria bacterium]
MPEPARSLEGKIALVTGASRGVGRAVAIALAREGAQLILQGRIAGALEETDDAIRTAGGKPATIIPLNLTQADRVDGLGPTLYQRFGHLDILVANAGVLGSLSPLAHVTDKVWADTLEVNLTANWRLVRTLDPLLKRAGQGRAVFVSSGASSGAKAYWGPYAVTKAGLEALARTYAAEVASTNIRVNIVNPGPVATAMRAKAFPGEDPARLPAPDDIAPLFVELCDPALEANGETFNARDWLAARSKSKSG